MNNSKNNDQTITSAAAQSPALRRDLMFTIVSAHAFLAAGLYSSGWFFLLSSYIMLMVTLSITLKNHSTSKAPAWVMPTINGLGCIGLIAALWFSGRLQMPF